MYKILFLLSVIVYFLGLESYTTTRPYLLGAGLALGFVALIWWAFATEKASRQF